MRPSRFALATTTVVGLQAALGTYILTLGPTRPIPAHFGADGSVDRWSGRGEAGGFVLAVAVTSGLLMAAIPLLSRRLAVGGKDACRVRSMAETVLLIATSGVCGLVGALTFGWIGSDGQIGRVGMGAVCALLATLGGWLGKVGPNPIVGVRTPWTFASRLAWDKSNRLAGRLLFWGGLTGVAASPFVPEPAGFRLVPLGAIIIAAAAVFESWRVWRSDPERKAAM